MSEEPEGTTALALPTVTDLVRLRWMLEHAESLTRDTSDPGRHLAVIALDGAVEYALWLVVNTTGTPVKSDRPTYAQLSNAIAERLEELGRVWEQRGRAGVDQLRRARNPAQHAGVAVDAGQLAGWSDAAHAYVDSLLQAALDVRLVDAMLALAVSDSELRERLTRAERAVQDGDAEVGFSLAWIAFELAFARWRHTRRGLPPGWSPGPRPLLPGPDDELRQQIGEVEQLLDVAPFAADLGEFVSLQRSRVEQETTGWTPEIEDARRALRFAAGWVVRWEVFERGYPAERWRAFHDAVEPISVGRDRPGIVSVNAYAVQTAAGNPRWLVQVRVADVPERGRGDWGIDLPQCFTDASHKSGAGAIRLQRLSFSGPSGALAVELDPDVDADVLRAVLVGAVEIAHERYVDRNARASEVAERREALVADWQAALEAGAPGVLSLHDVVVDQRSDGPHFIAELAVTDGTDVDVLAAAELLRSRGGRLANAGARDGRVVVDVADWASEVSSDLRDDLRGVAAELTRRHELRDRDRSRFRAFARDIEAGWADRPGD